MKIVNQSPMHTTYFVGFALLVSVLSFSILLAPAHALSCLSPTEMIDDYVTDEDFAIARVVAGELDTTGSEHEQEVTVTENLKGTMNSPVTFFYDDTWAYLCAGEPADVGEEAVYITREDMVMQVITPNTPLYDSLMTALSDTPDEPSHSNEEAVKRTLMLQIIDLLQQVISLLQNETSEPTTAPTPEAFIGMSTSAAEAYAAANDIRFRVVEIDDEPQPTTKDYRPGRINASVEDGVVVSCTVEGEDTTEPETGAHDAIIGMTQAEAETYAETNNVPFRIGRIDDEYLALTMDYRPGRITAKIEDGMVVDYSVE